MRKHDRDGKRKCRNWQTSKTKDLVGVFSCGFKSHLPHERLKLKGLGLFCLSMEDSLELLAEYGYIDKKCLQKM